MMIMRWKGWIKKFSMTSTQFLYFWTSTSSCVPVGTTKNKETNPCKDDGRPLFQVSLHSWSSLLKKQNKDLRPKEIMYCVIPLRRDLMIVIESVVSLMITLLVLSAPESLLFCIRFRDLFSSIHSSSSRDFEGKMLVLTWDQDRIIKEVGTERKKERKCCMKGVDTSLLHDSWD